MKLCKLRNTAKWCTFILSIKLAIVVMLCVHSSCQSTSVYSNRNKRLAPISYSMKEVLVHKKSSSDNDNSGIRQDKYDRRSGLFKSNIIMNVLDLDKDHKAKVLKIFLSTEGPKFKTDLLTLSNAHDLLVKKEARETPKAHNEDNVDKTLEYHDRETPQINNEASVNEILENHNRETLQVNNETSVDERPENQDRETLQGHNEASVAERLENHDRETLQGHNEDYVDERLENHDREPLQGNNETRVDERLENQDRETLQGHNEDYADERPENRDRETLQGHNEASVDERLENHDRETLQRHNEASVDERLENQDRETLQRHHETIVDERLENQDRETLQRHNETIVDERLENQDRETLQGHNETIVDERLENQDRETFQGHNEDYVDERPENSHRDTWTSGAIGFKAEDYTNENINDIVSKGSTSYNLAEGYDIVSDIMVSINACKIEDQSEYFRCKPCLCESERNKRLSATCGSYLKLKAIPKELPKQIHSLDMSLNLMRAFQLTEISTYSDLDSLNLYENRIEKLTLENATSGLRVLNLGNNLIKDLTNVRFRNIHLLKVLVLSKNNLNHIPFETFKGCRYLSYLDISHNAITLIDISAFDSLSNLHELSLYHNKELGYNRPFFNSRLFRGLTNLENLQFQGCSNGATRYPSDALGSIKTLRNLSIDGLGQGATFETPMEYLTQLKTLAFGGCRSCCHIQNISSSFFENLPYLKSLSLDSCKLLQIDKRIFGNLSKLENFTISNSWKKYPLTHAFGMLEDFVNSSLKYLELTRFSPVGIPCRVLSSEEGKNIQNMPLVELNLSENDLVYLDIEFLKYLPKTLKILRLSKNKFYTNFPLFFPKDFLVSLTVLDLKDQNTEGVYITNGNENHEHHSTQCISKRKIEREVLYNINTFSLDQCISDCKRSKEAFPERNTIEIVPETLKGINEEKIKTMFNSARHLPPNLTTLLASRFFFFGDALFSREKKITSTSLKNIDFSKSFWTSWGDGYMPSSVEHADLSENYCKTIKDDFIQSNNSLKYLCISINRLGKRLASDTNGSIFAKANKLIELNIADNIIFKLPPQFLRGMQSLQKLILRENQLHTVEMDFSHTPDLQFLDISRSSISYISRTSRLDLDTIAERHSIKLDLSYNPLRCTCEGIEILEWLVWTKVEKYNKQSWTCYLKGTGEEVYIGDFEKRLKQLEAECTSKYFALVSTFTGVVILLLIGVALIYKHRWKLIYARNVWLIKMFGFRPMGTSTASECRSMYRYDAYVVYCDEDKNFALDTLLEELEQKRGHKVCVEERDFIPGSFNFNNIICAVKNSAVTLLLLSPAFLRDRELEYATQMALMEEYSNKNEDRRDVILVLNYKKTTARHMPKDLLMMMKKGRFLDYPLYHVDGEGEEEDRGVDGGEITDSIVQVFWNRLSKEIGHSNDRNMLR